MVINPKTIKIAKLGVELAGFGLSILNTVIDDKILDHKIDGQLSALISKLAKNKTKK